MQKSYQNQRIDTLRIEIGNGRDKIEEEAGGDKNLPPFCIGEPAKIR